MDENKKLIVFQDAFKSVVSTLAKLHRIVDEDSIQNEELERYMSLTSYLKNAQLLIETMTSEILISRQDEIETNSEKH